MGKTLLVLEQAHFALCVYDPAYAYLSLGLLGSADTERVEKGLEKDEK
jgi:hypothetical protein